MPLIANLRNEVAAIDAQSDYVAVELFWNALIKAAHTHRPRNEFDRLRELVNTLSLPQVIALLQDPSVDRLSSTTIILHHQRQLKITTEAGC